MRNVSKKKVTSYDSLPWTSKMEYFGSLSNVGELKGTIRPRGTPWIRLTWLCTLRKQPLQQMGCFPTYPKFNHITSSLPEENERQVCDAQRSLDHQTKTPTSVSNRATTKKKKKPKILFATWNVRTLYQEGRLTQACRKKSSMLDSLICLD
jgi:hypothetical protein